jgi:ATP-dependent Clp protease ATP-binding subunit ClpA
VLQKSLTDYIENELRAIVVETGAFPGESRPTAAFQRVMQRAQTHAEQMGQQEITGNNMMVVIFAERISPAVRRLYSQNMTAQDAANFVRTNPEESDAIVTSGKYASKGIEPGNILTGVKTGRLIYDVQPTWDAAVNAEIWKMLDAGLKYNQIPALPEKQAVLDRAPAR